MIFFIGNLQYNTDKMERIAEVQKWYQLSSNLFSKILEDWVGDSVGRMEDCTLWKSKKGRWLLTYEDSEYRYGQAIDESEARSLLLRYAPEAYERLYGEIEEA